MFIPKEDINQVAGSGDREEQFATERTTNIPQTQSYVTQLALTTRNYWCRRTWRGHPLHCNQPTPKKAPTTTAHRFVRFHHHTHARGVEVLTVGLEPSFGF